MPFADIWFPFYVADYLKDTQHLTTEEHGAYLLLLFKFWNVGGSMPFCRKRFSAIAKCSQDEWDSKFHNLLSEFFLIEGDIWTHKRVMAERIRADAKSEKRSENGKLGGRPKANGKLNESKFQANQKLNETPSQSQSQSESQVHSEAESKSQTEVNGGVLVGEGGSLFQESIVCLDDQAMEVYSHYPRKVSRPSALKAIKKAIGRFGFEKIIKATIEFGAMWKDSDHHYCPYPATWFNDERFNDESETWRPRNQNGKQLAPINYDKF